MTFKINIDLAEKGIKELEKIAFNRLESAVEESDKGKIQYAIEKALETREIVGSLFMNADLIDNYFFKNGKEIKKRFGIDIPGYTS